MRRQNLEIEEQIKLKTKVLLMEKDPAEIGMRDIASSLGVTATTIYHYFKDKDDVFRHITRDCMKEFSVDMKKKILGPETSKEKLITALKFFRDWCFENPRMAFLVMGKVNSDPKMTLENVEYYYGCHKLAEALLEACNREGSLKTPDCRFKANFIIASLWGCISSILTERTEPEYWKDGIDFTNRAIEYLISN